MGFSERRLHHDLHQRSFQLHDELLSLYLRVYSVIFSCVQIALVPFFQNKWERERVCVPALFLRIKEE